MEIELPKNLRLIKLPSKVELTIFLIKEELRNRKFTNNLTEVGFDTSDCVSDFSTLILGLAGFEKQSDEIYEWYFKISEEYIEKFELGNEKELTEQGHNFYMDLVMEKRRGK